MSVEKIKNSDPSGNTNKGYAIRFYNANGGVVAMMIFNNESFRNKIYLNYTSINRLVYIRLKSKSRKRITRFLRDDHPSRLKPIKS